MNEIKRLPFDKNRLLKRRELKNEIQDWLIIGVFVLLVLVLIIQWSYQSGQLHALRSIG